MVKLRKVFQQSAIKKYIFNNNALFMFKVRLQAMTEIKDKESMFKAFGRMYREEGIKGLWRVIILFS